ncbi:GAF and ANTAR domain-containing protein [Arthrobacter sp. Ld5]|uniref:GAF and ANTAR domain-containing protein n=1 Tax=Arthrobacter sp. Ld5 TaxID=649152 RepID=UPI003EC088B1
MNDPSSLNEIAPIIGRTQGVLLTEQTAQQAVSALAAAAKEAVPHAVGAGVSLIKDNKPTSVGATDRLVLQADELQYDLGDGPCLSAWSEGKAMYIEDTETDRHWHDWSASAVSAGIRSCYSVPLQEGPRRLGAMKIYAATPDAFTSQDQHILAHLALSAAVLLGHIQANDTPQRLSEKFKETLRTRDTIAIARGIIMEQHDVPEDEALTYLLERAGDEGISLRDVARIVLLRDGRPKRSGGTP